MEVREAESAEPWEAALVAVIRIFAARGRAIREERARSGQPTSAEGAAASPFEVDAQRPAQTEDEAM